MMRRYRSRTLQRASSQPVLVRFINAFLVLLLVVAVLPVLSAPADAHPGDSPSAYFESIRPACNRLNECFSWTEPFFAPSETAAGYVKWHENFAPCEVVWGGALQIYLYSVDNNGGRVGPGSLVFDYQHGGDGAKCSGWQGHHWEWPVPDPKQPFAELLYYDLYGQLIARAKTTTNGEVPPAPSALAATNVTASSVTLTWTDNATYETSQQLQRSDDGRSTWTTVATLPADQTTYTDMDLAPGHTYWYRVRASNSHGDSGWSNELEVSPGCALDTDCDGLNNSDETDLLGTDPKKPDTDADGLLDPWEAPSEKGGRPIENHGFTSITLPALGDAHVSRDQVFGPYAGSPCSSLDGNRRVAKVEACLNGSPPDPLHKDVWLELDWQDCYVDQEQCFELDPLHHAPDFRGLEMVTDMFASAPVSNPNARSGVALHMLIDEAVPHYPNCDQDFAEAREQYFGTEVQRGVPPVVLAKTRAVRYVWSGHSSWRDDHVSDQECPTPDELAAAATGMNDRPLESYDQTAFGDANIGGRDVLVTLGILWACHSGIHNDIHAFFGACYRDNNQFGVYPAHMHRDGERVELPYPINRLVGVPEDDGHAQVWARTVAHLMGHSLGLETDSETLNDPTLPGTDLNGDGVRDVRAPDQYVTNWSGLSLAPGSAEVPSQEAFPDYSSLTAADLDSDGVPEGEDNCPGVSNPKRDVAVFGGLIQQQPDADQDGWGDACDEDADADGLSNPVPSTGAGGLIVQMRTGTTEDSHPLDTDNDALANAGDADDDGDRVPDALDNCSLATNASQLDTDLDLVGDRCEQDDDADGYPDALEVDYRTNPKDGLSAPAMSEWLQMLFPTSGEDG